MVLYDSFLSPTPCLNNWEYEEGCGTGKGEIWDLKLVFSDMWPSDLRDGVTVK